MSQQHQTLSVADYIKVTDLSNLVNNSVNACAAVRPHPALVPAFLSQHFHKQHFESPAAVAIDSVSFSLCGVDGTGTPQLQLTLSLMDGRSASALVAHSCGIAAVHPSTSRVNRRVSFDVRQRSQRTKAVLDFFASNQPQQLQQQSSKHFSGNNNSHIHTLCTALCGSCSFPSSSSSSYQYPNVIRAIGGGGSSDNSTTISATNPLRDFDIVLNTADGSTNFSVLSSNIATAASIAFCKLRAQIHRTPLGLNQPLYKLLAKDFAFLENNSISNSGQLVVNNNTNTNNQNNTNNNTVTSSTSTTTTNQTIKKTNQGSSSSGSGSSSSSPKTLFNLPLPMIPLFSTADAPVFGKLRILKQVVIFPNPKVMFGTSSNNNNNNKQSIDIGRMLIELQQVVNICYEKLTTDETTHQPPIMMPHQGGTIKHFALETFTAVVDFVEECIREALPQYFSETVMQQMDALPGGGAGGDQQQTVGGGRSMNPGNAGNKHGKSVRGGNTTNNNNEDDANANNLVDVNGNPLLLPNGIRGDFSPVFVGLILDGSLCSMRGNEKVDQFAFGQAEAASSPGKKGGAGSKVASPVSKTQQQPPSKQNQQQHANAAAAAPSLPGDEPLHSSQPPPKYCVFDNTGAAGQEWTAAQLSDHLASLCATKQIVKYIQDSHREDQGGPSGEWMNDSWRRLTARCCGPERVVNVNLTKKRDAPPTEHSQLTDGVNNDICIAGDELFCSNQAVIERLAPETVCNTLVVRLNDAGTVTNAMNCSRCFRSIVNNGSVCVAAESCDTEAADSAFLVDFAFAIRANFLNINSSIISSAGCQGVTMLSRYHRIANEILSSSTSSSASSNNNNNNTIISIPSQLPDYSRIRNYAPEPIEQLGPLEVPNVKDVKKKR